MIKSGTETAIIIHPASDRVAIAAISPAMALSSSNRQPNVSIIAVYVLASIFADTLVFANMLYALFFVFQSKRRTYHSALYGERRLKCNRVHYFCSRIFGFRAAMIRVALCFISQKVTYKLYVFIFAYLRFGLGLATCFRLLCSLSVSDLS
jgi:hypothetical protein